MIEQGTEAWFESRRGKVTASRLSDVLATIKTGEAATRANYRAELIAERLTGRTVDFFKNAAIQWGTDCEPLARAAYEAETGYMVTSVGLVDHPTIAMAGASPDGLVLEEGTLEIKCPNTSTHISTLVAGKAPSQYIHQMQWQMACTGRKWCDFVSFDPRMPDHLQLFIKRVPRDEEIISKAEAEVLKFLSEVDAVISKLNEYRI